MSGLAMSVTGVILSVLSLALNPGINKLSIEPLDATPDSGYLMAWRNWGRSCVWGTREQCVNWLLEKGAA